MVAANDPKKSLIGPADNRWGQKSLVFANWCFWRNCLESSKKFCPRLLLEEPESKWGPLSLKTLLLLWQVAEHKKQENFPYPERNPGENVRECWYQSISFVLWLTELLNKPALSASSALLTILIMWPDTLRCVSDKFFDKFCDKFVTNLFVNLSKKTRVHILKSILTFIPNDFHSR